MAQTLHSLVRFFEHVAIVRLMVGPARFEIAAVSPSNQERHSSKQFTLGDVTYDIHVKVASNGMYRAEWTCSECGETGAWAPLSGDPTKAAELAKLGMEVHHSFLHRDMKQKKPR